MQPWITPCSAGHPHEALLISWLLLDIGRTEAMKRLLSATGILALLLAAAPAQAAPVTFTGGTPGVGLAAQATFNAVGNFLQVKLANVGGDVGVPSEILTAVLFNINGVAALTPISASHAPGSFVVFDP